MKLIPGKKHAQWLVALGVAWASSSLFATGQRVRTIEFSPLIPLVERLRADDEVVVVERPVEPSGLVDEPVSRDVEVSSLVATSDAAAIFDTTSVDGFLTDGGLWIRTVVQGDVSQFLFDRRPSQIPPGQGQGPAASALQAHWVHGGELVLRGVTVRARPLELSRNGRYLAFLVWDRKAEIWYLGSTFEIRGDGKLRHLVSAGDTRRLATSPLDQWTLAAATAAIKRAARSQ